MWRNLLSGGEWSREDACQRLIPLLCFLPLQLDSIVSSAKFGDLIEFSYPVGYSHWAVYDQDGYVIHFAVAGEKKTHT